MIENIIEAVKFFGGLGGLASSAFLVYDRIFRYRPAAFLIPAAYKNMAAETIIIDEIVINPLMPCGNRRGYDGVDEAFADEPPVGRHEELIP
jgi:hypothetical protein